jgi:hypothetical protein
VIGLEDIVDGDDEVIVGLQFRTNKKEEGAPFVVHCGVYVNHPLAQIHGEFGVYG